MAKNDVDKVTEEKIAKGGVLVKLYFDMQDKEKEKLQPFMVELINERLIKEKGVVYAFGAVEEPLERGGVYITSATVTMLFDSFMPLVNVAFNYAPAGIEILKPEGTMTFKMFDLQAMLMDISNISMVYTNHILQKVLDPEEVEKLKSKMDARAEFGKKLLEKKENK